MEIANLSELVLSITCKDDFRQIKTMGHVWKLKKFSCNFVNDVTNTNLQSIFEMVVENWEQSLEELGIWLHDSFKQAEKHVLQVTSNYRLKLPKLKFFLIKPQTYVSLDFLLPSADTLKTIDIEDFESLDFTRISQQYCETKKRQIVEYLGYEQNMKISNIWKMFKQLEWISKRDIIEEEPEPEFRGFF